MTEAEERFWTVAEPLLARADVTRSTMMGLPCLRWADRFFASFDRRSGDLVVKLPAERVQQLIAVGTARSFAPAGRPFREWAAVPSDLLDTWPDLLDEAETFAAEGDLRR